MCRFSRAARRCVHEGGLCADVGTVGGEQLHDLEVAVARRHEQRGGLDVRGGGMRVGPVLEQEGLVEDAFDDRWVAVSNSARFHVHV